MLQQLGTIPSLYHSSLSSQNGAPLMIESKKSSAPSIVDTKKSTIVFSIRLLGIKCDFSYLTVSLTHLKKGKTSPMPIQSTTAAFLFAFLIILFKLIEVANASPAGITPRDHSTNATATRWIPPPIPYTELPQVPIDPDAPRK
ncbi:hypothetical protein TWF788_006920 [Orbilia oligospora]|uniref:Uncharacterized protein n=1 Tax=Orbilia oligospora TaxID=2813651 RepID=A0A6G1LSW2_ORBOL|nr:hypothetical protein TWF788_006920 [Orbilia oligospora]KAF3211863.1 hypothetical protein TWF191_010679 [Orbilia oligospora]KAF3233329.1 hypothetical protein TWF192_002406 [Orbilia oligospora]